MEGEEKTSKLGTVVAILIALTTVIGAIIAWRASIADDASGDADFAGLKASLNAVETRAVSYVTAYEHFGVYSGFARQTQLGDELAKALSEQDNPDLSRQQAEAYDLAKAAQRSFPARFLNRDGSYNVTREMNELWADASRQQDLKPDPQYADADKFRTKTGQLLAALLVLSLALVCFALSEGLGPRGQAALAIVGTLLMAGSTAFAIFIDLTVK
jgi:hypothetical protein